MPSVDTNVLVRYVVRDDARQSVQADRFFSEYIDQSEAIFVPLSVALEFEWVLRSAYKIDKSTVLTVFSHLLGSRELRFQEETVLEQSLHLYRDSNADMADCIHAAAAYNYGQQPLVTFDRVAARLPHAQLISDRQG